MLFRSRTGEGVEIQGRVDDVANGLGLRSHVVIQGPNRAPDVNIILVEPGTERRLGRIEFPIERTDGPPRLRDYPLLILEPLKPGEDPIEYRLTPGFFSGDRTGALYVEVR